MRGIILAATLMACQLAAAAPPPGADPALAPWFNNLRQPWTNALCCSMSDCRITRSRLQAGHYEAFVGGEWRRVPDDTVLQKLDNPTGHAVVCWTAAAGILCFVPPPQS